MNFWKELNKKRKSESKPIVVLAPMADVTDAAFRYLINKYGKPDVTWTEFVSADGMIKAPDDNPDSSGNTSHFKIFADLDYDEIERPIVAQLFSPRPEMMKEAAKIIQDMGFDGLDINMGCPEKNIVKQGSGAGHLKEYKNAQDVILAAKEGAPNLPISVKTRIGFNQNEIEKWLPNLLETKPDVITLHCRTRKEMSDVPADWSQIKRAVEIRDNFIDADTGKKSETLIFGNGDVLDLGQAYTKYKETGCDGIMIGRGIFGNPWLFSGRTDIPVREKLEVLIEHVYLYEKLVTHKNFNIMKKHFKAYVEGFDGAKELRVKLMNTENGKQVEDLIREFLAMSDIAIH